MSADDVEGWVVAVQRHKGQRIEKYYIAFAKADIALSALRASLKLTVDAVVEFRDKLRSSDMSSLGLRPGQIVKI